ncbi:MAG: SgcJ/EcaC family oxidoreductase [Nitrospirota bacterium]|nr:SgcJ/EcaC family oxidoreductase [Nitrospirota bacterium]
MKKLLMIIPLVILLCFTFSCQQGEEVAEEAALSDEDVAAIKASTEAYVQAVKSEDFTAFAALYTEDAVLMPPNQPIVQGREAILTWAEAFPPLTEFSLSAVEIDGRGDLAFVRGTYSMTIALEGAPEPIQDTGKYIEIRRKQEDGSWLIARDIFNSDLPLPPPPEKE